MYGQDLITAIAALGAGLGAIVYGYQKYSVSIKKDSTTVASEEAQTQQYKLLTDAITSNKNELVELRAAFQIMDRKLHVQQRTITRMEMLLRQFSGLVSQHGISVPAYMQAELEALIESDTDRQPTSDARPFP
jgi:hypothetical protein